MEGMDPRHLGMMGKKAMEHHNYPDALRLFSMGLAQLEARNLPRQFAAQFLMDQAECHWQLGNVDRHCKRWTMHCGMEYQEMPNSQRLVNEMV